jgi:hypothetical protein
LTTPEPYPKKTKIDPVSENLKSVPFLDGKLNFDDPLKQIWTAAERQLFFLFINLNNTGHQSLVTPIAFEMNISFRRNISLDKLGA